MKRTSDRGNRCRISATRCRTLSIGCVVCAAMPMRGCALERQHIVLVQHDVEVVEIFGQPAHLDVGALADDDRVIAVAHERR